MRHILILVAALPLGGCVVSTIANTAVKAVTLPVHVASSAVDKLTTSQAEADQKRGREVRKEEEARGRAIREAQQRCRSGTQLPTDNCPWLLQQR